MRKFELFWKINELRLKVMCYDIYVQSKCNFLFKKLTIQQALDNLKATGFKSEQIQSLLNISD